MPLTQLSHSCLSLNSLTHASHPTLWLRAVTNVSHAFLTLSSASIASHTLRSASMPSHTPILEARQETVLFFVVAGGKPLRCGRRILYTYTWVVAVLWRDKVRKGSDSCHTYGGVMVYMNESWHTCEWVMAHAWMSLVTHMTELFYTRGLLTD